MRARISEELALLRETFGEVDHVEAEGADWFRIKRYPFPTGWAAKQGEIEHAEVLFNANASYPTGDPYAFWAPLGLLFNGQAPQNVTVVPNAAFGGQWLQFSWAPDQTWRVAATVRGGSNLRDWAKSFATRLAEGI